MHFLRTNDPKACAMMNSGNAPAQLKGNQSQRRIKEIIHKETFPVYQGLRP